MGGRRSASVRIMHTVNYVRIREVLCMVRVCIWARPVVVCAMRILLDLLYLGVEATSSRGGLFTIEVCL